MVILTTDLLVVNLNRIIVLEIEIGGSLFGQDSLAVDDEAEILALALAARGIGVHLRYLVRKCIGSGRAGD
jgi:hypothetical protein